MPPSVSTWVLALAVAASGCDGRSPAPPRPDASVPSVDGSTGFDAGVRPRLERPDGGPRLPSTDREVVLPYLGDAVREPLEVVGEVGTLDIFFSIDTTGSFGDEIDNLQAELRTRIVPSLRDRVEDVSFGVGRFEDFPTDPFGAPSDLPFRLLSAITSDDTALASAVASLDQPLGRGADSPESGAEALWQITTGEGYPDLVPEFSGRAAPGGGVLGGAGFREDALRLVVHVTDAPSHEPADYGSRHPGTHSIAEVVTAMNETGIRTLGVASGEAAREHLETLALGTGAVMDAVGGRCPTGVNETSRPARDGVCPLVFDVNPDGTGLATTIVDALADFLATVRYDEVWGETDDALGFVRAIEAVDVTVPAGISPPGLADLRPPGDSVDDTFTSVGPGTELRFRAVLRNETIPPADYDQIFNLELRIVGDGVTLLTRSIRVVVPRGRLDAGLPDAGGAGDGGLPDAGSDSGIDAAMDGG